MQTPLFVREKQQLKRDWDVVWGETGIFFFSFM
jgi:hypothetical protein